MEIRDHKDLKVWQKSMDLVVEIYKLIDLLPREERFALADQMRRSAVSIPSNIAEGHSRKSSKAFANFLSIARGSRAELQTQLAICERLNYLTAAQIKQAVDLSDEVGRMLAVLSRRISDTIL